MIVNLNSAVKVKLTEEGRYVHYSRGGQARLVADADGYYRTQLWALMADFGKHRHMGQHALVENNNLEIIE